jgi:hypothetical protein
MAWTRVQHTFAEASAKAFASNVTSGNLLICSVNNQTQGTTVTGIADSQGSYTAIVSNSSAAAGYAAMYYRLATATGADTVTITWSGTALNPNISIEEWSGNKSSSPVDKSTSAVGNTGTAASSGATATLTNAADLAFGYISCNGAITVVGSGWTGAIDSPAGNDNLPEFQILSTTTGIAATATVTSANPWVALVAAFLPAGGAVNLGTCAMQFKAGITNAKLQARLKLLDQFTLGITTAKLQVRLSVSDLFHFGITPAPVLNPGGPINLGTVNMQFLVGISQAKLKALLQAALQMQFGMTPAPKIKAVLNVNHQFKFGVTHAQVTVKMTSGMVMHIGISPAPALQGGGPGVLLRYYFGDGLGIHRENVQEP